MFADGRLKLRHGPIDLIVESFGSSAEVKASYQQATKAFSVILCELAGELTELRKKSGRTPVDVKGQIASEMVRAAQCFSPDYYVTPMIAVAGAVADHVLEQMVRGRSLSRAYVNNGGDIALFLSANQSFNVGVCDNPLSGTFISKANIDSCSDVRGIASSGWRGRSHSLGIADAVTVLARTAAIADASATLIANAIDIPDHPLIKRTKASLLNPDSDLGARLVTVDVGAITPAETQSALNSGRRVASSMIASGQIIAVHGCLNSTMFSLDQSQCIKEDTAESGACQSDQERLSA